MGVEVVHYVVAAAKLDCKSITDREDYDDLLNLYDDNVFESEFRDGMSLIVDGMNGEYAFFGQILSKGCEQSGGYLDITKCKMSKKKRDKIAEEAQKCLQLSKLPTVNIWAFTHVT